MDMVLLAVINIIRTTVVITRNAIVGKSTIANVTGSPNPALRLLRSTPRLPAIYPNDHHIIVIATGRHAKVAVLAKKSATGAADRPAIIANGRVWHPVDRRATEADDGQVVATI